MSEDPKVRALFERMNLVLAGSPVNDVLPALEDIVAATMCIACADADAAERLAAAFASDVAATVRKNFDWYRDQALARPGLREGQA